jgi:hypothetical protein
MHYKPNDPTQKNQTQPPPVQIKCGNLCSQRARRQVWKHFDRRVGHRGPRRPLVQFVQASRLENHNTPEIIVKPTHPPRTKLATIMVPDPAARSSRKKCIRPHFIEHQSKQHAPVLPIVGMFCNAPTPHVPVSDGDSPGRQKLHDAPPTWSGGCLCTSQPPSK